MKFYIADKFGIDNLNEIDVTMAVSHFHDVVISKEGQPEGQNILLDIRYKGEPLQFDKKELLAACKIAMPVDQKRNMMNASSNFNIIDSILEAIVGHRKIKIHTPGVSGEIGGYPVVIDGTGEACMYFDESIFRIDEMRQANRESIYLDGIANVSEEGLEYTDELLAKVKNEFGVVLPKRFSLNDSEKVSDILITQIIQPCIGEK